MKKSILLIAIVLMTPVMAFSGGMNDDPLLTMVIVDQFEVRTADGSDALAWDAEGWIGKDLHKLWIKTDGAYSDDSVQETELQVLYSRAIKPFWDVQFGWRGDLRPTPERNWLTFGFKGLAPYFFDVDTAVFIGSDGDVSARLQAEYEIMLTQRLILVPEIELNLYGQDDPAVGIGSGFSEIEVGIRLRYEIRREFAPYIGLNWTRQYGATADYAREEGEEVDNLQFVFGLRLWF